VKAALAIALLAALLRAAAHAAEERRLASEGPSQASLRALLLAGEAAAAALWAAIAVVGHDLWGARGALVTVCLAPAVAFGAELLPRARATAGANGRSPGTGRSEQVARRFGEALGLARLWERSGLGELLRPPAPGEIDRERRMADRVFAFAESTVGDVMVPLVNVSAVREDTPLREVIRVCQRDGFSRLPVYRHRIHNIVGVVRAFDLLAPGEAGVAADLMRPAPFVWEMTPARLLLRRLQREGVNLVVVVDEHGGAVGIIAIEDLLEEIVGEIEDEFDVPKDRVRPLGPGRWQVEGQAEVDWLNDRFPWRLPTGAYETIGGLLLSRFDRIPQVGDAVELDSVTLRVAAASPRAVELVEVRERGAAP